MRIVSTAKGIVNNTLIEWRGKGISGENDEGFVGTIIKDTWTIMGWGRRLGNGREVGRAGS